MPVFGVGKVHRIWTPKGGPPQYYSIGFYCRIHTASKYLHNDLARAIKALDQKKNANGSSVNMSGTAEIGVQMHMSGPSGDGWRWKKARLNVLVGSIRHNILSITLLTDSGWRFTQGPKRFWFVLQKAWMHCLDVADFANCPWVRLHPDVGGSSAYKPDLTVSNTHDLSLAAVSGGDDSELARHRRQGHIPFNPNCLECAKGRSVFRHRQRWHKRGSIQADFAFLNTTGEIVATSFEVLWRSLCWLRWCRGVLAMWWSEKMSKQPGDRSLYGFNILGTDGYR